MYNNGQDVLQDYKAAVKWFTLAAEQGHAKAQHNLGISYALGEGVLQDFTYGHMWLNIANANGADASKSREIVEESMTPAQIEQAQALARECVKKEYKDC
jgi:TPR repeat protein